MLRIGCFVEGVHVTWDASADSGAPEGMAIIIEDGMRRAIPLGLIAGTREDSLAKARRLLHARHAHRGRAPYHPIHGIGYRSRRRALASRTEAPAEPFAVVAGDDLDETAELYPLAELMAMIDRQRCACPRCHGIAA